MAELLLNWSRHLLSAYTLEIINHMKSKILAIVASLALASGAYATNNAFIAFGNDTAPDVVITVGAGGSISVAYGQNNGPYDGVEDTYVGVINNSGSAFTSLAISSAFSDVFGFDGDGEAAYTGVSYDGSGYAGPDTSFTILTSTSGIVNFLNGGIDANGGTGWFTLEESISASSPIVTGTAPESSVTVALLGAGLLGLAALRRRFVR